jgi:phage terminase large subunit-like protein
MWTEEAGGWIAKRVWKKIQCEFDYRDYAGRKAWIGLDLSKARDLTSGAVVIEDGETIVVREDEDGEEVELVEPRFASFNVFWMPKDNLREREDETKAPYTRWANLTRDDPDFGETQYLSLTPGAAIKMAFVAHWLKTMGEVFDLQGVAFDEYRMDVLQNELDEINLDIPLVAHPQGFRRSTESGLWMPASIEKMEECVVEERLRVNENPVLTWNIAGVYMEESPEGNQKFHKRKSKNKIDGAVAKAMAIGLATNPPPEKKQDSYLNSGGLVVG